MALLEIRTMRDLDWEPTDRLQLVIGSEGAADLANSTPAGGTVVEEISPYPDDSERGGFGAGEFGLAPFGFSNIGYGFGEGEFGYGAFGINDISRISFEHPYTPTDKCESLPVGVKIKDQAGNVSAVLEDTVELNDAPIGARDLIVTATQNTGEATLLWTASPDV